MTHAHTLPRLESEQEKSRDAEAMQPQELSLWAKKSQDYNGKSVGRVITCQEVSQRPECWKVTVRRREEGRVL